MRVLAGLLALWAGAAGAQGRLDGHGGPIMDLAVTEQGRVVSASFDNSVGLWSSAGVPAWLEGHQAAVTAILPLPDGALVSAGDDFRVLLWSGSDAAPVELGRHAGKISDLAASGDHVISASWDGTIALWPLDGGKAIQLAGHEAGVNAVVLGPSGRLWSASSDGSIRLWDVASGTSRPIVRHGFGINRMVLGDGWLAYGAVDGVTRIVDPLTGDSLRDYTLDRRPILSMAHEPRHGLLAVGDGDGWIMVLNTADWSLARDFRAMKSGPVWALAFSADGATLWAGGLDQAIHGFALDGDVQPIDAGEQQFLRPPAEMSNGERQFMRKCSICHALSPGPSRRAGPSLAGLFGRRSGTLEGYPYSERLSRGDIVWTDRTIDALFDQGPDHYVPGTKMPMQVIARPEDRADLIAFLRDATETTK
ncbi:c-type cytochrome [Jannaschia aquimarina]|uniref:CycA protein n=1 Tax=Jannaschia aquimarina TaxID=935700 RepID=A0A0D1EFP5_9RHOB|nr:c-type cytochrome [Jannaschia aquimarina]KIT15706.1 Cytochrome c2 precursor [Jannaschia aquimarina]SNT38897.1 cytochrome c [Jannaschia aquimarina]